MRLMEERNGEKSDDILYRIEASDHNHKCRVLRIELGVVKNLENVMTTLMARRFDRY